MNARPRPMTRAIPTHANSPAVAGSQRAMREPAAGVSVKPTEPSVPFDDQQSDGLCHLLGAAREGGAGAVRGDPLPLTMRG